MYVITDIDTKKFMMFPEDSVFTVWLEDVGSAFIPLHQVIELRYEKETDKCQMIMDRYLKGQKIRLDEII